MWKYNPKYNIRFANTPRVILPPLNIKKHKKKIDEDIEYLKTNENDENEVIYHDNHNNEYLEERGKILLTEDNEENQKFRRKQKIEKQNNKNQIMHHETSNNEMISVISMDIHKGHNESHIHSEGKLEHRNEDIELNALNKGNKLIPYSKRIKAPNFDKYTGRKDIEIPLTRNVDFYLSNNEK